MKKRITALALACMASLGAFTGCGEEKTDSVPNTETDSSLPSETSVIESSKIENTESNVTEVTEEKDEPEKTEGSNNKSGDVPDTKNSKVEIDGEYYPIYGIYDNIVEFRENIDNGIDTVKDESVSKGISFGKIIFDDGNFNSYSSNVMHEKYYGGSYDTDTNGEIKFKYKELTIGSEGQKSIIRVGDESEKRVVKTAIKNMEEYNKTGTYFDIVKPKWYYNDKYFNYGTYPIFYASNLGIDRVAPVNLIKKDSFLCIETYGMEIDGNYQHGEAFTINFDALAPFEDDEYACTVEDEEERKAFIEKKMEYLSNDIKCSGSFKTTIEFSDGKWEWYNADDGLINNGVYQESKTYYGLIEMYMTESSLDYNEHSYDIPILFYINDGEIYYPGFIKLD